MARIIRTIMSKHPAMIALLLGTVISSEAANIYEESFDYGDSTVAMNTLGAWSSISAVLKYDHDGGLEHAQLGAETGGSMWLDFTDKREASDSTPDFSYGNLSQGDKMWVAVLFQYVAGNTEHFLSLAGGVVSGLGITINTNGSVIVNATRNTTLNAPNNTGINVGSGTHLMVLRATKGSGTSPVDSQIDLWINPADTSSEGALGAAHWTLDSGDGQIKWGRDTDSFTSVTAQPSQQGRIDEIRIGQVFSEVLGGVPPPPPPGTLVIIR